MFDSRVVRKIFGPKREELTRDWRKLYTEELHDVYSSPNVTWVYKYVYFQLNALVKIQKC
jgi:hypothetical protein